LLLVITLGILILVTDGKSVLNNVSSVGGFSVTDCGVGFDGGGIGARVALGCREALRSTGVDPASSVPPEDEGILTDSGEVHIARR